MISYIICRSKYSDSLCLLNIFWLFGFSLKYINIAMVTILKNVTNILTAIGELYMFRKHQNQKVWTAMFFMVNDTYCITLAKIYFFTVTCNDSFKFHSLHLKLYPISQRLCNLQIISAISGGITDLSFDATGYAWQTVNCVLTASYSVCFALL